MMEGQGKQFTQMILKGLYVVICAKRGKKNSVSVSGISKERNKRQRHCWQ